MCATYFFFFNDTATTEIYTLSLHDALPISTAGFWGDGPDVTLSLFGMYSSVSSTDTSGVNPLVGDGVKKLKWGADLDRKGTRLNSSHANISYAVFCLKKKNTPTRHTR